MPTSGLPAVAAPFPEFDPDAPQTRTVTLPSGRVVEVPLNPSPDLIDVLSNAEGVDLASHPGFQAQIAANAGALGPQQSPTPTPEIVPPSATVVVGPNDRSLLAMTRSHYSDEDQFAGLGAALHANPIRIAPGGNPLIRPAQPLQFPDVAGLSSDALSALDRLGRSVTAKNTAADAASRARLPPTATRSPSAVAIYDPTFGRRVPTFRLDRTLLSGGDQYIQSKLHSGWNGDLEPGYNPILEPFYRRSNAAHATFAESNAQMAMGHSVRGLMTGVNGVLQAANIGFGGLMDDTLGRAFGAVNGLDYATNTDQFMSIAGPAMIAMDPALVGAAAPEASVGVGTGLASAARTAGPEYSGNIARRMGPYVPAPPRTITPGPIVKSPLAAATTKAIGQTSASRSGSYPARTGNSFQPTNPGVDEVLALEREIELGTHKPDRGHHIPAKRAFEGVENYDPKIAPTIPKSELGRLGLDHNDITGQQKTLYMGFAKTGQPLTWDVMREIETQALVNVGLARGTAHSVVTRAIQQLQDSGVQDAARTPWGGSNVSSH